MDENLRHSGIDIIDDVPWGTHFCQFYENKEDLIEVLVPYFKTGLENNEFCMWVTSQPLEVEDAKEALRKTVPNIDVYLEKGQLEIIFYFHWYVKDGIFDSDRVLNGWVEKLNKALANGYDGLRLTGNTFWLEKEDWNDFVDYEKNVDSVIGNYQMIALCTYNLDRCNATEIIDIVINHQFALIKKKGKWEQIESSRLKEVEKTAILQSLQRKKAEDTLLQAYENLQMKSKELQAQSMELLKTNEQLLENEQRYSALFNAKTNAIAHCRVLIDEHGEPVDYIILQVNGAYEEITGIEKANIEGKTATDACLGIEHLTYDHIGNFGKVALEGCELNIEVFLETCQRWLSIYVYSPKLCELTVIFTDATDRKQMVEVLQESEERFRTMANTIPELAWIAYPDGYIYWYNEHWYSYTGTTLKQMEGWGWRSVHDPKVLPKVLEQWKASLATGQMFDMEFPLRGADVIFRPFLTRVLPLKDAAGNILQWFGTNTDITEQKRADQEREMAVEFLQIVNNSKGPVDLVHSAINFFHERSGFEAIGIRLKDGDDYPYFETSGFPAEFVKLENRLCVRDASDQLIRDSDGYPIHECMCGNVICGRFDPSKPFFTTRGSFCTNSTTELLATTTDADRQARTRNRCNGEGYESVALIALRVGEVRLGLLQLNDRRKGQFTPEKRS